MADNAQIGTGSTITFDSGFFAEILNVEWSGISRAAVETSHFGSSGGATFGDGDFVPGDVVNPGELSVEINWDPDTTPPIGEVAETLTLTFRQASGESAGTKWAASGFMTEFEGVCPYEDRMTATCTIKFSGGVTITPAVTA